MRSLLFLKDKLRIQPENGPEEVEIQHQVQAQNSAIVKLLPTELLLCIFLLLRDHRNRFRLVCRLFNELIVGSPSFWSIISIHPFTFRDRKGRMMFHPTVLPREEAILRLEVLSRRTGTIPLTIIWNTPYVCSPPLVQEMIIYFLESVPFSRWRRLELYDNSLPHPYGALDVRNAMENFITGSTILEELQISGSVSHQNYILSVLGGLNHRILTVEVKGDINDFVPGAYAPFFRRATHLSIIYGDVGITEFSDSISTLHIDKLQVQPYTMPRVSRLTINWCGDLRCLASLEAPLLTHLQINDFRGMSPATLHTLIIGDGFGSLRFPLRPHGFPKSGIVQNIRSPPSSLPSPWDWTLTPTTLTFHIPTTIEDLTWFSEYTPSIQHITIKVDPRLKTHMYSWLLLTLKEQTPVPKQSQVQHLQAGLRYSQRNQLPQYTQKWKLCPDLVSLTLSFEWAQTDTDFWRPFAREILVSRSSNGAAMERITFEWSDGNKVTRRVEEFKRYVKIDDAEV